MGPTTPAHRARTITLFATCASLLLACSAERTGDAATDDRDDATAADLQVTGPEDGALLGVADLEDLAFTVTVGDDGRLDDLRLLLDGDEVTDDLEVEGATLTYTPRSLDEGERHLVVTGSGDDAGDDAGDEAGDAGGADGDVHHTWRFTVDTTPPEVELDQTGPALAGQAHTVSGTTEPGAVVTVGDERTTTAADDGTFTVELDAVDGPLTVSATDPAGNTTDEAARVVTIPSRVELDEIRTVHATFWAWATPSLRDPIEQMLEEGRINSLQLDLKDEGGQIGYPSEVALANEIGADIGPLDLAETVADLHERDIHVIGRIVAFADPTLAPWAWENDRRELVIHDASEDDFYRGSYAGFANYANQEVIDYLLDLAEEAAQAGVDHILWDYIRRPEGIESYEVPGLETTPEEAIVEFTRQAEERLAPYGVTHGASVYGIAADRPEQIGQDIPAMAQHLDVVAPMIYPSHWGPGEYDVADPNRQPYDIITAILAVFEEAIEGTDARIVPWLEDTPYRAWDRPHQVREQIRAAEDAGRDEWLMWNPNARYTPQAYARRD